MDDDDRAELYRQKSQIESLTRGNLKLQAEVERLRAALREIRDYDQIDQSPKGICPYGCDCPDIARRVLEGE